MRRLFTLLYLFTSVFTCVFGQSENDLCATAITVDLGPVMNCPNDAPSETTLTGTTLEATPTQPVLRISDPAENQSFTSSNADVWYSFTASANRTTISVAGELEQPVLVLLEGDSCNAQFPVALKSGISGAALSAPTEPGTQYFLLVSSSGFGAEGDFSLKIKSQNNCSTCGERRGQLTVAPVPLNGTYEAGQEVTFCYTPTLWAPGFSLEWLHGLDIDFGDGWDLSTLEATSPTACTAPDGSWGWHENWEGCMTGNSYGPGFAFDSNRGLLCSGGSANDGLPGNNYGDGPCGNLQPAPLDLEFCWTVRVKSTFVGAEEGNLNLDITMLGDGNSGSWMMSSCVPAVSNSFMATAVPQADAQPGVAVLQPACPALCNGALSLSGGNTDAFTLFDADGSPVFSGSGPLLNTVVGDLCPGTYQFVTEVGGDEQAISVEVPAVDLPEVSAAFAPACFPDDPYQLQANADSNASNLAYNWTGPDNFSSAIQNPVVFTTGTYLLETTLDDCPIAPVEIEVSSALPEIRCAATQNSITFNWSGNSSDTAYTVSLLTGQDGQLLGDDAFIVGNLLPGEAVTLELIAEGLDQCPQKVVEKTCMTPVCPQPDAGPDTLLCGNGGIELSVEADTNAIISWAPNDGLSCTDCPNPIAAPEQTTTYQVTITNAQGCEGIDFVTIYVDEIPGSAIPDAPLTFCPGEAFSFCLPEDNQYLWISPNWFLLTGDCLNFPYTSNYVAGEYTIRAKMPNGCRVTETITLAVDPGCQSFGAPGVSTGQTGQAHHLRLFPNPASSQVELYTSLEGQKDIHLRSLDGRTIIHFRQSAMEATIDLQGIPAGTYVVQITGERGSEQKLLSVK